MLAHQGLLPPRSAEGKKAVMDYIRRVGCIQFDPLDIAGCNHELVLQSRIKDFRRPVLQDLLYRERRLVDGWDKNAAIYPVEDWPFFSRMREAERRRLIRLSHPVLSVVSEVRQQIEERGPLSSSDLGLDQVVDWPWAPTRLSRAALDGMLSWGELVIHHKTRNRKVYDLASRHLPLALLSAPDPNVTEDAYLDWHVERRIGSVGLLWNRSGAAWLGVRGSSVSKRREALARLALRGEIVEVSVEGAGVPFYMRSEDQVTLTAALTSKSPPLRAAVLAPLDNLLWDRQLVQLLFGFDYTWEVYKPASQRKFGYYVLPVLYGDRFVARVEPRLDRKTNVLVIRNWWWEQGESEATVSGTALRQCLERFAGFLGAGSIGVENEAVSGSSMAWLG